MEKNRFGLTENAFAEKSVIVVCLPCAWKEEKAQTANNLIVGHVQVYSTNYVNEFSSTWIKTKENDSYNSDVKCENTTTKTIPKVPPTRVKMLKLLMLDIKLEHGWNKLSSLISIESYLIVIDINLVHAW